MKFNRLLYNYLHMYRESYGADMNLLGELVWPEVKSQQIAHDAYCCEKFPNSRWDYMK